MAEENIKENDLQDEKQEETVNADAEETTQEAVDGAEESTETEEAAEEDADSSEEQSEGDKAEEEPKSGKKFGKKKDKKDAKDTKIEELTDQVKRQMAEFENFRKRTEKEKSSMYEMGAKAVIEKILPIIDNFERGLAAVPEGSGDAFFDGMQLIYKQLLTELDAIGVKPIEAVGQPFDPNMHNAVMQVESEEFESGTVAQELQKGYMYRDTVVRYSMVAVVQ